ncbi:MAG: hypothetical protein OEW58_06530 [Gammaproteobacteria bacterium]|nr:hypothetical protein [Gammaproteobacteria bacterium]
MSVEQVRQRIERLIEPHLPMVQLMLQQAAQQSGQSMAAFAQNDKVMAMVLRQVHGRLPLLVRLALREERFVTWVLNNRNSLFKDDGRFRG